MKQERVIAILDFYRDIDKTVTMNERVIRNLEDQYHSIALSMLSHAELIYSIASSILLDAVSD